MKNKSTFIVLAAAITFAASACSKPANETAVTDSAIESTTNGGTAAAPTKTDSEQAIELAIGSPESAALLARKSPEPVATAAAQEARRTADTARSGPESATVKINALLKLTQVASEAAPGNQAVKAAHSETLKALSDVEKVTRTASGS